MSCAWPWPRTPSDSECYWSEPPDTSDIFCFVLLFDFLSDSNRVLQCCFQDPNPDPDLCSNRLRDLQGLEKTVLSYNGNLIQVFRSQSQLSAALQSHVLGCLNEPSNETWSWSECSGLKLFWVGPESWPLSPEPSPDLFFCRRTEISL